MKHIYSFLIFALFSFNLYPQVAIPSNEQIIHKELNEIVNCITAKDAACTPGERYNSALILELFYSNDLINKDTSSIIQGKLLYSRTKDTGISAIWSGITLGVISNYVSPSEKEHIYKSLKLAVANKFFPLAGRIGSAEGLGYVKSETLVQDVSSLLKELAQDMETESFNGNDENGFVSLSLFKALGTVYERTENYDAKRVLIDYSNTNISTYPLTQTVWANIAAGQTNVAMDGRGITETLPNLKKIATWHEVKEASDLHGIWAVPLTVSQMAWSLIPEYIRTGDNIAQPKVSGWENALGWTAFSFNCLDQALRTILYIETGTTVFTSIMYGSEMAAVASPLANSIGEQIAARYGTELAYGLGVTTASTELATAFASTTTGKIVNRIATTAQKIGAKIDKVKILIRHRQNVSIKLDIPKEVTTSLNPYRPVDEGKATPNYKYATPEIINKAKVNAEFPENAPINKQLQSKIANDAMKDLQVGDRSPLEEEGFGGGPSYPGNKKPLPAPNGGGGSLFIPESDVTVLDEAPQVPTIKMTKDGYFQTLDNGRTYTKIGGDGQPYRLMPNGDMVQIYMTPPQENKNNIRDNTQSGENEYTVNSADPSKLPEVFKKILDKNGEVPLSVFKIFQNEKFIPHNGTLGVIGYGLDFYEWAVPLLARKDIKIIASEISEKENQVFKMLNSDSDLIELNQNLFGVIGLYSNDYPTAEAVWKQIQRMNPALIEASHIKSLEDFKEAIKDQITINTTGLTLANTSKDIFDMMLFINPIDPYGNYVESYINNYLKSDGIVWMVTENLDASAFPYEKIDYTNKTISFSFSDILFAFSYLGKTKVCKFLPREVGSDSDKCFWGFDQISTSGFDLENLGGFLIWKVNTNQSKDTKDITGQMNLNNPSTSEENYKKGDIIYDVNDDLYSYDEESTLFIKEHGNHSKRYKYNPYTHVITETSYETPLLITLDRQIDKKAQ